MMKDVPASPTKTRKSPSSSPRKAKAKKPSSPSKPTPQSLLQAPPRGPTVIQKAISHAATPSNVFTIWYAAHFGKHERVQSILDRKAVSSIDVQEYRTKWTALHFAARFGQIDIVQLLLDRGANPDLQDLSGNSPLHLSAGWGNLRCTVLLLEAGANTSLRNQRDQTPLEIATTLARHDQLRVLSSWQPLGLTPEELHARRASRSSLAAEDLLQARVAALQSLETELQGETDPIVHQELHALFAKTQHHGETDPTILATLDRLCAAYTASNRNDKALSAAERALTLAETLYGHDDLVTLTWLNNTGELLLALDRMDESEQHFAQAYDGYAARRGSSDHATLAVLENLAVVTVQRRDLAQAERHLRALLEHLLALYDRGWNDRVFELQTQLGVVVLDQHRVLESQQIFRDCLDHASASYGDTHALTLGCLEQLGRCAFLLGDLERAERLFTRVLRDALAQGPLQGGATQHRRLHNNLAMLAIARKSASAVERKLQEEGYNERVPEGYTTTTLPATSPVGDVAATVDG